MTIPRPSRTRAPNPGMVPFLKCAPHLCGARWPQALVPRPEFCGAEWKYEERGTWAAQSVKRPTLHFGSGHDLTVGETEPCVGLCPDSTEPAWDSLPVCLSVCLSLYLSSPPLPSLSKINKQKGSTRKSPLPPLKENFLDTTQISFYISLVEFDYDVMPSDKGRWARCPSKWNPRCDEQHPPPPASIMDRDSGTGLC